MDNMYKWSKIIATTLLCIFLLVSIHLVLTVESAVVEIQQRVKDTSQNVNAFMVQAGLTADLARQAAEEQRGYWSTSSQEFAASLKSANNTLVHFTNAIDETSANLNSKVLAQSTQSLKDLSTDIHSVSEEGRKTLNQASVVLIDTSKVLQTTDADLANAGTILADPNWLYTQQSIARTAENVARITETIDTTTTYIQDRITAPERTASKVGKWLLRLASPVFKILF